MPITLGELKAFRKNFDKTLTEQEEDQKRGYLYAFIKHKRNLEKKNQQELISFMFANIYWVKFQFYNSENEGAKCLKESCKIIKKLTNENRRLSVFYRDIELYFANFKAANLKFNEAIPLYIKLIGLEQEPNRKTIVIVNLLRSYIKTGQFYKALDICRKKESIVNRTSAQLKTNFFLLNARLLLILGYESLVEVCLHKIAQLNTLEKNQQIELQYLQIFASANPASFKKSLRGYDDIIDTLTKQEREHLSHSYELEKLLFLNIIQASKAKNRKKFIERCRFLARKANDDNCMFKIISDFESVLYSKSPSEGDYIKSFEALHNLYQHSYHLLFVHLTVQFIDFLIKNCRFGKASLLLQDLKAYHAIRESGISQRLLNQLKKSPSRIRDYYNQQIDNLPEKFQDNSELHKLIFFSEDLTI